MVPCILNCQKRGYSSQEFLYLGHVNNVLNE